MRESRRVLYLRGSLRKAELPRGRTFLSVIRSGRSTSRDGSESSQKSAAHLWLADHVAAVAAAAQSYPQYKTSTERRLRRRGAERAPAQHKDGLDDHADEDVLARDREREQHARIQDHA